MPSGGSCLLGSINLAAFVKDDKFDFDGFKQCVEDAVVGLNEVLDEGLELHPLQVQRDSVRDWRQIGLGILGLADMLIKLRIKYGSEESIELCDKIGATMSDSAIRASSMLSKENGSFNKFNVQNTKASPYFQFNTSSETRACVNMYGLRNSQLLTIAPTGSISTMIGVSGGIEPIFANYYTRKTESLDKEVTYYKVYTKIVKEYMDENGVTDDSELPEYFVTSPEIPYEERVRMQSIWQSHIDASISSTVNLPNSATPVDIYNIYMAAYEEGLKGITVFRDGCERAGILTTDNAKKNDHKEENTTTESKYEIFPRGVIERVPPDLDYRKYKLKTGCGNLYLFIGIDEYDGKIYDIFTNTDGVGGCTVNTQAVSRLISACLRSGTPIEYIIEQLNKTGTCPSFQFHRGKGEKLCNGKSCPSAIANILKDIVKEFEDIDTEAEIPRMPVKTVYSDEVNVVKEVKEDNKLSNNMVCQECGNKLVAESGCVVCKNCGWSKCE